MEINKPRLNVKIVVFHHLKTRILIKRMKNVILKFFKI